MGVTSGISVGSAGHWYRVQAVSQNSLGGTAAADYASILPAALHAARQRRPFIAGWLSRGDRAPLELVTNAAPLPMPALSGNPAGAAEVAADPAAGEPAHTPVVEMLFPWGARGTLIDGNMIDELDQLVWAPCPGRQVPIDGSHARGPAAAGADSSPTLFEAALQTLMGRPFGWLIVADPADLLDAEAAELQNELSVLRRYEDEQARSEARRMEQRLAELDQFREAGLWQVRVLVGAATEQELDLIAPLLVGSADLSAHPYRLRCPAGAAQEFADVLATKLTDTSDGSAVPFAATAGALAALTGLPGHEVPGVRLIRTGLFGVTADAPGQLPAVELGRILDGRDTEVGTFAVSLPALTGHALVTGAAGSGKSETIRHLLDQLARAGARWLAVEPAKSEYAVMAARLDDSRRSADQDGPAGHVMLVNPADPQAVPLTVNPLAPEPGYPVQGHIDMVRALFVAAFDGGEAVSRIMSQALQGVYSECGWDTQLAGGRSGGDGSPAVPALAQLHAAAVAAIEAADYGREPAASLRGLIDVRLGSLRAGAAARFLEGGHPADIGALLARNVVLTLEDVASDEEKAFLTGALIIRMVEHLRLRFRAEGAAGRPAGQAAVPVRHVLVLEEAHGLLRAGRAGVSARAVELFASLLAEVRAYGEGIVVADQMPARVVPDVLKNTALTVLHRLPAADDRQLVGTAMNLDERQSRQVVSLPPGEAVVFAAGMDRPIRVKVPLGADREPGPAASADPAGANPVDWSMLAGRRSPACGQACVGERPCTLAEIRAADLVAGAAGDAWLRVWAEVYVLAHLVNRPRPRVPVPLRHRWAELPERLRACALATAVDLATQRRGHVLRESYDPAALSAACAASAVSMLDGGNGAGTLPGTGWVLPQLKWLHELERVCPLDGAPPDPFALAPPLDYALPRLPGGNDVKIGQRVSSLRRHPLSMEVTANRLMAWTALLGVDDHQSFIEDLAAVAIGVSHRGQLRKVAGEMGVTGWLEAVLSWPRRFIVGVDDRAFSPAREPDRVAG